MIFEGIEKNAEAEKKAHEDAQSLSNKGRGKFGKRSRSAQNLDEFIGVGLQSKMISIKKNKDTVSTGFAKKWNEETRGRKALMKKLKSKDK